MFYIIHLERDTRDGTDTRVLVTDDEVLFDLYNTSGPLPDGPHAGWSVVYLSTARTLEIHTYVLSSVRTQ